MCVYPKGTIGGDFIFTDDNARPHRAADVQQLLESEDMPRMNWPRLSPDISSIEHVWDALGRLGLVARLHPPRDTQLLKQMIMEK
ncbi:transposable element Tc1 transposase [Trichonephila clavipes]|nr:transposable element Tc1 transposase [Trichonephila clavipes]